MKHLQTYNESIRDKMIPKSDEDILKGISDINTAMINRINDINVIGDDGGEILKNIRLLLDNGANPSHLNHTLLRYVGWLGDLDFLKDLIEKYGVGINDGEGALLKSSATALKPELIKYIIDNGGDIKKYGKEAIEYCISYALNNEYTIINECVLLLVNNGVSKDVVRKYLYNYGSDSFVNQLMIELEEKLNKKYGSK